MVEHPLNFIVAGIIPEAFVVEVGLVNFDWRSLVAKHEFLEGQEAQIPRVTFLVGHETRKRGCVLDHWAHFELPKTAINISVTHEWNKVFQMFWLVSGHWHHANVSNHVAVVDSVIMEFTLVVDMENIEQLRALPNGICAKDEIVLVVTPLHVSDAKVVVLWHFQWTASFLYVFGSCAVALSLGLLNILVKVVYNLIVYAHLN